MTKTDLKGMSVRELEAFLAASGKERYRARQISRWIHQRFAESFDGMTDLSKPLRDVLRNGAVVTAPSIEQVEISSDGTEKYLFRLGDGEGIESVLIPDEDRRTLCISSQAGCALACAFCATGALGFRRNMTSAEIVHQVDFARHRLAERGERLSNTVFMGMGEPLLNPVEVGRTIEILLSQYGHEMAGKRVTVSTAGVIPALVEMSETYPVSFAVSVNAARDDIRSEIMPINRRYPLKDLVAVMRRIPLKIGRKITAEYVLLAGVNDSDADATELVRLFRGANVMVNLIPFNAHRYGDFTSPSPSRVDAFRQIIFSSGVQTITRERRGGDISAACGQLSGAADGEGRASTRS